MKRFMQHSNIYRQNADLENQLKALFAVESFLARYN